MPVKVEPTQITHTTTGWIEINPRCQDRPEALALTDAHAILELPGEVVCGHPDRHVVRVELAGAVFYLKRQHRVGWRERFRQWCAGFGWSSRCEREAKLLRELDLAGFPSPNWVAYGEDDQGRAFLLLEELTGSIGLRGLLSDNALSHTDRREVIQRLGCAIAELHVAGFDTPDLTAKHVFIDTDSLTSTLIDWKNASRGKHCNAVRSLAALHASLADDLASTRDRLRFLRSYCHVLRQNGRTAERFSMFARRIAREAARLTDRRSIRDQRQPAVTSPSQRLVWLAGEAVCAVPDVAVTWPTPAIAPPFYDSSPAEFPVQIPDGRDAALIRGRSFTPIGRFRSWLRGRSWRSPGVGLGRILFHLERYGIPAPKLFAFGQRFTSSTSAEWFVLHESPVGLPLNDAHVSLDVRDQAVSLLTQLHNAGCRIDLRFGIPFRWTGERVVIGDPRGIRIVRKLNDRQRRADRASFLKLLRVTG